RQFNPRNLLRSDTPECVFHLSNTQKWAWAGRHLGARRIARISPSRQCEGLRSVKDCWELQGGFSGGSSDKAAATAPCRDNKGLRRYFVGSTLGVVSSVGNGGSHQPCGVRRSRRRRRSSSASAQQTHGARGPVSTR